jgi:biotin operon repressor
MNMLRYRIILTIEADQHVETLESITQNMCEDFGIDVKQLEISRIGKRGRPAVKDKLLEYFLEQRTRPFSTATIAAFLGVDRTTAWKRLERLVLAGRITKTEGEEGAMMYEVVRL